jgi:SAM-dependent methyltransferase
MKWQLRFLKNALFGLLPFPDKIRKLKRTFLPYPSEITKTEEWIIELGIRQVEMLRAAEFSLDGKVVLEIGTGWKPIIPFIFRLTGCKKIILTNIQKLLDKRLLVNTANNLIAYKDLFSERLKISIEDTERILRISTNCAFDEALEYFNMQYLAPYDIRKTLLPNRSIDVIISHAVLEHVPPDIIKEIFLTISRLLKDDGKMCHVIDNSDHWEHLDKSISRLNFLKFNDNFFKFLSSFNPLDYQNRLRHFEYLDILHETGFKIDLDWSEIHEKALNDLQNIKLCKKYRHIQHDQLGILTSHIVASKKK